MLDSQGWLARFLGSGFTDAKHEEKRFAWAASEFFPLFAPFGRRCCQWKPVQLLFRLALLGAVHLLRGRPLQQYVA